MQQSFETLSIQALYVRQESEMIHMSQTLLHQRSFETPVRDHEDQSEIMKTGNTSQRFESPVRDHEDWKHQSEI